MTFSIFTIVDATETTLSPPTTPTAAKKPVPSPVFSIRKFSSTLYPVPSFTI